MIRSDRLVYLDGTQSETTVRADFAAILKAKGIEASRLCYALAGATNSNPR